MKEKAILVNRLELVYILQSCQWANEEEQIKELEKQGVRIEEKILEGVIWDCGRWMKEVKRVRAAIVPMGNGECIFSLDQAGEVLKRVKKTPAKYFKV